MKGSCNLRFLKEGPIKEEFDRILPFALEPWIHIPLFASFYLQVLIGFSFFNILRFLIRNLLIKVKVDYSTLLTFWMLWEISLRYIDTAYIIRDIYA